MSTINSIAVVDVETTGLYPWRTDRIIEIAVILVSVDGKCLLEYETLVNPERDLGPTHVHRITAEEVKDAPKFNEIAGDVLSILKDTDIIAGHNISFDRNFLIREYGRIGIELPDMPSLCTCNLLGRMSLEACCKELDVFVEGEPHRAISDARQTVALFRELVVSDPSILDITESRSAAWPSLPPTKTVTLTRDNAREKLHVPPAFLERLRCQVRMDVDDSLQNTAAYLALLDRALEDRLIGADEEEQLIEVARELDLSMSSVTRAHEGYLNELAIHALADDVITETEWEDIHRVARLLGIEKEKVDSIVKTAKNQMQTSRVDLPANTPSEDIRGMKVCFTGELQSRYCGESISRSIACMLAEQAGLEIKNSVTKKLDLLVVADPNSLSGKAKKARQYEIRIIAEQVFWRMIGVDVE